MALYIASYDLHRVRNYHPIWTKLESWGATRLLESLWVFSSNLPVGKLRDELRDAGDSDDSVAIIELKTGSEWASCRARELGASWLSRNIRNYG
jgi:hypothetical protein